MKIEKKNKKNLVTINHSRLPCFPSLTSGWNKKPPQIPNRWMLSTSQSLSLNTGCLAWVEHALLSSWHDRKLFFWITRSTTLLFALMYPLVLQLEPWVCWVAFSPNRMRKHMHFILGQGLLTLYVLVFSLCWICFDIWKNCNALTFLPSCELPFLFF